MKDKKLYWNAILQKEVPFSERTEPLLKTAPNDSGMAKGLKRKYSRSVEQDDFEDDFDFDETIDGDEDFEDSDFEDDDLDDDDLDYSDDLAEYDDEIGGV